MKEQEKVFHIKELNEQAEEKGLDDICTNNIKTIFNFWAIKNWIKRKNLESKNHIAVLLLHAKELLKEKLEKRHILAKFIIEFLYEKSNIKVSEKYSSKEEHFSINCKDYPELKKQLLSLYKLFAEIENNVFPFKAKLISDYRNNLFIWKDKLSRTENTLAELPDEKLKQFDRSIEIKYPSDKSLIQLKSDAEFLLQLFVQAYVIIDIRPVHLDLQVTNHFVLVEG